MPVNETPLDVGMSSNVLEFGDTPRRLDGIGVYTQALEAALIARGVAVRRIGAPMRVGARFVAARHAALSFPLPMAFLTAAATATTAGLRGAARLSRFGSGLCGYGLGCLDGSGSLDRRLLLLLLFASKPAQAKSPSCARAAATPGEAARSVRGKLWSEWNI